MKDSCGLDAMFSHRLMLRRILATYPAKLGVMLPAAAVPGAGTYLLFLPLRGRLSLIIDGGSYGYGTIVHVRSVQFLPNQSGLAQVEGGSERFRLVQSKVVDGYTVARVETYVSFTMETLS